MDIPNYTVRRSNRRTLALEVTRAGEVVVRAPYRASDAAIAGAVAAHAGWIAAHLERVQRRNLAHPEPTEAEMAALRRRAEEELPVLVAKYGAQMGLQPASVRITSARTRFGSCSGKNAICFSWRLMAYPQAAIEYVVVHELAHIVHKNHGPAFYACVAAVLPDWRTRRALLRE